MLTRQVGLYLTAAPALDAVPLLLASSRAVAPVVNLRLSRLQGNCGLLLRAIAKPPIDVGPEGLRPGLHDGTVC